MSNPAINLRASNFAVGSNPSNFNDYIIFD